jgi:hypothetical protein
MKKIIDTLNAFLASLTRPYPARDWFVVLILVFAAFAGSVFFAGYLLIGIRSGDAISPASAEIQSQPSVTKGDIQKTLEMYRARRVNYEAHNLSVQPLKDPR